MTKNNFFVIALGLILLVFNSCKSEDSKIKALDLQREPIFASLYGKAPRGSKYIRPKSAELLPLLETGQIDYFFSYRNVAVQHGLSFLELPKEINLSSEDFAHFYRRAMVKLSDGTVKRGAPINFGITMPNNAPNPDYALAFMKMVLGPQGKEVVEKNGQPFISPALTETMDNIPAALQGFFEKEHFQAEVIALPTDKKITFRVFHAGSLTTTFFEFEKLFEKQYPNVDVINEPNGSITAVKQVTELHKLCDIVAVADYIVIPEMMIPEYTDWYGIFATNEMVLIYNDRSKYANEISADNWYQTLAKKDVTFGRSDPDQDPSGYYTELIWKLSDIYYKFDERGRARLQASVEKRKDSKRGVLFKVSINQKPVKEITRKDFGMMLSSKYQVKSNPIKKGVSFVEFFQSSGIKLKGSDEITVTGKGKATFNYSKVLENDIGFVITRQGTPKVVARKGDEKLRIAHIRTVEIDQK